MTPRAPYDSYIFITRYITMWLRTSKAKLNRIIKFFRFLINIITFEPSLLKNIYLSRRRQLIMYWRLIILSLKCKFTSLFIKITLSEKCLTKFFQIRNPNTSSGCIFLVVVFGILKNFISLFTGLASSTAYVQCPLQK